MITCHLCPQINRGQLQLLCSACLLVSSKLLEARPLSLHQLVVYTDCSVTGLELRTAEMMVLSRLGWELVSPTPLDFLPALLDRLRNVTGNTVANTITRHCTTFIALAKTEYTFYNVRPSVMVRGF